MIKSSKQSASTSWQCNKRPGPTSGPSLTVCSPADGTFTTTISQPHMGTCAWNLMSSPKLVSLSAIRSFYTTYTIYRMSYFHFISQDNRGQVKDLIQPGYRRTSALLAYLWFSSVFVYMGAILVATELIKLGTTCPGRLPCLAPRCLKQLFFGGVTLPNLRP